MSDIQEQIKILIQVQDVDGKIIQVDRQINAFSQEAARLDRQVVEHENQVADEAKSLDDLKKIYRELETESKLNAEMIVKSNEKLRAVKTNKEYQSIIKEIEELHKKNSGIEDQMLANLEAIESLEAAIVERTAALEGFMRTCQEKKASLVDKELHERQAIEELNAKKSQISVNADPKMIAILEEVRKKVRGSAVVPVQQATCMGCHMNIPAQLFNELQRFDQLRFCPHCHRIIYWKETERE